MEKSAAVGQTPVPPYEANPQAQMYGQPQGQPHGVMQHQDSYQINQVPQQQYPQQPVGSPGPGQVKQEYYAAQPGMEMQHQHQSQQQVPQVGVQPQQSQYRTATPLHSLGEAPAPVDCPSCGNRALTRIEYKSGQTTLGWAAVICACFCLGCIPYLINGLKDIEHKCGHCGVLLARWHRSGRTVVHAHA